MSKAVQQDYSGHIPRPFRLEQRMCRKRESTFTKNQLSVGPSARVPSHFTPIVALRVNILTYRQRNRSSGTRHWTGKKRTGALMVFSAALRAWTLWTLSEIKLTGHT